MRSTDDLVVDASVAAKWYLPDEPDTATALRVLHEFEANRIQLTAPTQILYEVPSVIIMATRQVAPRLSLDDARQAVDDFLDLGIRVETDIGLLHDTYQLSVALDVVFYDAAYLALAHRRGVRLITADRRLYQRMRHLPEALWIGDWRPAP